MRVLFATAAFFICVNPLFSQVNNTFSHLKDFERVLTPSPTVGVLGSFGGMELEKTSGGISKNIPLLDVGQGNFKYQPSIQYFSTGIKVDDWGSRVGIGWTENLTAVITRTVRSVPDELATSRISGAEEFGTSGAPEYTMASYDKIFSLSLRDTRVDGEYDLFSYNLFGLSGQFIIQNNNAVLLSKEQNVKITINATSPTYQFTLTTSDGIIYSFNSQVESVKYNHENACDFDNPSSLGYITTAWFADKINSLSRNINISFSYENIAYTHFYDFAQFYTQSFASAPTMCEPDVFELQPYNSSCFRKKDVRTKLLRTVQGTNFTIEYDYLNRQDLFNEKLLQKVTFSNPSGVARRIEFKYDTVTAISNFEGELAGHIAGGDETEAEGLRVRYFLNSIKVMDAGDQLIQQYKMDYLFPFVLPHRFSFSQDMFGCYNGIPNDKMIPAGMGLEQLPAWVDIPFRYADRRSYPIGAAGLLKKIQYPTGGSDSIIYETNSFATSGSQIAEVDTAFQEWYTYDFMSTGDDNSYNGSFFDIYAPFKTHTQIVIKYYAEDGAETGPGVEQFATVTLMSATGPVISDQFRIGDIKTFNNVLLETNKDYWLLVDIFGKHTVVWASIEARDRVWEGPPRDDKDYMGYRLKSVISVPIVGLKMTKRYNYNVFSKNGTRGLTFSDTSSLTIPPAHLYHSVSAGKCFWRDEMQTGGAYEFYPILKLNKNPNYSPYVFNGNAFTYKMITEFTDSSNLGFTAEEYEAVSSTYGSIIMGGETVPHPITLMSPTIENSAWNQGLLKRRIIGAKSGSSYLVNQEEVWNRSATSEPFYNYSAGNLADLTLVATSNPVDLIAHYVLIGHNTYSYWVKLDSMKTTAYSSTNTNDSLVIKRIFQYNAEDRMVEEEYTHRSDGKMIKQTIYRPTKMVSLGLDNNGVYASMKAANLVSPEIVSMKSVNTLQIGLERLNYTHVPPYYVPASIQTQLRTTDPLETRALYNKYDSYGNVLEQQLANNVKEVYLWGYRGQYPVARVVGMSYDELQAATNMDTTLFNNATFIISELSRIRNVLASHSLVQMWSYTYRPMVGMTSETDPAGRVFYYEYDDFDRLSFVKDKEGNILKHYYYNYTGQ